MSDESTTPAKKPRTAKSAETAAVEPVDAEVVETSDAQPVVVETSAEDATVTVSAVEQREVEVRETEPVVATDRPDDVVTSVPRPQVIYVTAPAAPRPRGNRGFGALIALVAALVFGVLLAVAGAVLGLVIEGRFGFGFLGQAAFYVPVIAFLIGFVILVLIVNRAAWWTYIVGSIFVALFVYFATIGYGMITEGLFLATPAEARELFVGQLGNPFVIVSALLAREVSMWVGAGIAARGRRVKARNAADRDAYDRGLAEKRAEHERGAATAV
jgi:hypothetical protein